MVGGVDARAPWPAGGLLVRGFGDDQMGDLVRGGGSSSRLVIIQYHYMEINLL